MFFPTATVTAAFDDLISMFLAQGFKKHVTITGVCHLIGYVAPILEEKKARWYGEDNYKCVDPRNDTCDEPDENGLCFRNFEEVIEEIGKN